MPILELQDMTHFFGGIRAVAGLNMALEPGELVGLIGPNGAGKTTVFNLVSGVYKPTQGRILLHGRDITGLRPSRISRLGLARTFQNIRLFKDLSVLDNVRIGCHTSRYTLAEAILRTGRFPASEREIREEALRLLSLFGIEAFAHEIARNLPYGMQRKLEIARAMATKPGMLLLDEPTAGMNPQEVQTMSGFIRWLRDEFHLTILLIEHRMSLVMSLCERIVALDFGETIASGTPHFVRNHPKVLEAYLGGEEP